jgi:predicted amidohydrolase
VAAAQPTCVPYDVTANVAAHVAAVGAARTQVVVFPELSLTGYELDAPSLDPGDARLAPLVKACAETGSTALAGAPLADGEGRSYIGMLAVNGTGVNVAYRKVCVDVSELRFTAGPGPRVVEVDGWRLGLAICKDTGVGEHTAATVALGVDVYVAGTLMHHHEKEIQDARAVRIATTYGIPVVLASFAGPTGGGYTSTAGCSGVWSAAGVPMDQAGPDPGGTARAALG